MKKDVARKPLAVNRLSLVRIRLEEPALSRTYEQYFEFFISSKPRQLDTPSFTPPIAFGVSLSRNAAQAFLLLGEVFARGSRKE
jgi:hypothetical protein